MGVKLLAERARVTRSMMTRCALCPRKCGADRNEGNAGICRLARNAVVYSAHPHFGEENPLVGIGGSGTIFFSGCTMRCVYCQNYDISQTSEGKATTVQELSEIMLSLQSQGCHNINFVTPTHVIATILEALPLAIEGGLSIPLVYNTSGYERVETLKLLEGIFDIYLPDAKYWFEEKAEKYSSARDYPDAMRAAIAEMHRQVGDLETTTINGVKVATNGVLVRHLVLPNGIAGSKEVLDFLCKISPNMAVNVMDQYRPCYRAYEYPELGRRVSAKEYIEVMKYAQGLGLNVV